MFDLSKSPILYLTFGHSQSRKMRHGNRYSSSTCLDQWFAEADKHSQLLFSTSKPNALTSVRLSLYNSEQYSVHRFSICRSSVRHFPERSWTVVAFPCFTVVKSFTSWYALLLLFFLRFSSISLHCSPIQFSFAFFMHLLMLLFTSLYFSDPSGSNLFFLSSLLLSHRSRISAVIQVFFLLTMFAKDLTGCFSHCCVEGGDH